ncbi:MAG: class B sortase [Lachnospiraceae bacterium]|nr:class B sortase [Lachnospiraceae bacterium]
MNHKKEKSKIWLVLFYSCFAVVVIAAGILFKNYIDSQAANSQLDSLQASVNGGADGNAEDEKAVYINGDAQETTDGNVSNTANEEILMANANTAIGEIQIADAENNAVGGLKEIDISEDIDIDASGSEVSDIEISDIKISDIEIPKKDLDWDDLHEQNKDIYAWIYVPDTTVDYPILQHPTDNSYYLNHNMDGTKGYPGCIYTENFNSKDFSDIHTVIYGHNLKAKTMFSSLHNFEKDDLFSKEHYIYIYTQDYVFVYRIFAAYEFSAIHLLDNYDYTNEYVYADYLKQIYKTTDRVANVKEDIKVTTEDKIVTLSTCTSDHDSNRRFLVTGVLVNPKG